MKQLKTIVPPVFLQYYRGMRVWVIFHTIYRYRTFLRVFFVGLGDHLIDHKKTIETDNRKRIESEKIKIYEIKKKNRTNFTTILG